MTKADEVRAKVTIPMYFYNIIVPQLGSYYAEYEVNFDARPVACCPLHDEDTPSMRYYEETNTFYCFGCRKGGDVITLHRQFTERQTSSMPTFNEAIEFLYNYFIKGNEHIAPVKKIQSLLSNQPKSSNVDLARYSNYTAILERQLQTDHSVKESAKREIWKAMDITEILIDKNMLSAVDAMEYIKGVVRDNVT